MNHLSGPCLIDNHIAMIDGFSLMHCSSASSQTQLSPSSSSERSSEKAVYCVGVVPCIDALVKCLVMVVVFKLSSRPPLTSRTFV